MHKACKDKWDRAPLRRDALPESLLSLSGAEQVGSAVAGDHAYIRPRDQLQTRYIPVVVD